MTYKIKNQEKPSWSITPFLDVNKVGTGIEKVVMRGTTDRDMSRINRRKRQKEIREEKRRQNSSDFNNNTSCSTNTDNNGSLDLQLVPINNFPIEEIDDVVKTGTVARPMPARTSPVINIEYASDDDSVSLTSSEFTIENFVQGGNAEIQSELQHEMRNVLQALFGEIRQLPEIGNFSTRQTTNQRQNNSGNDLRSTRTPSH